MLFDCLALEDSLKKSKAGGADFIYRWLTAMKLELVNDRSTTYSKTPFSNLPSSSDCRISPEIFQLSLSTRMNP